MSVSCPSLWSTPGRTVFSVLDRDLKRFIFLISHAGQHSVLCCTPRFLPSPYSSCLRPTHPRSLLHTLFRASWIEVRPSCAKRPLTRLHPLWSPVFSFVWEALAWKLPRALLQGAVL